MITRFRIQNYKSLRDVSLDLTRVHLLIGPNDSGKSSILEAIEAMSRSVELDLNLAFRGSWEGYQLVWRASRDLNIDLTASIKSSEDAFNYQLICKPVGTLNRELRVVDEHLTTRKGEALKLTGSSGAHSAVMLVSNRGQNASEEIKKATTRIFDELKGVHSYRWDSRFLSLPVAPDRNRRFRMESSGFGLALCLDEILSEDRKRFGRIEQSLSKIFPYIKSIKLRQELAYKAPVNDPEQFTKVQPSDGKGIYFQTTFSSEPIPARQTSDGVLLILAYLTVANLPIPPRILLIEEPENGIHPKRLEDVISIIRDLAKRQKDMQVLMTTHSPYIVDLFNPEEVTLCRKQDDGAVSVHRLSDSNNVQKGLDIFTLGEIWTAEGEDKISDATNNGDTES